MKFIHYESLKNWKSKKLEDIIDVTDEIPEKIRFAKPTEENVDWLQFIDENRYQNDQFGESQELKELTSRLFLSIMKSLEATYTKKGVNLRKFMRRAGVYTFDNNYLFQALFHYARFRIIQHYLQSHQTYSNYDSYLLDQSFVGEDFDLIMNAIEAFKLTLPPASAELQEVFELTPFGSEQVWWDLDGAYREHHEMTQVESNIMASTTPRTTKPWSSEYKNEIVDLYLLYWKILLDEKHVKGPTLSEKRNMYISRVTLHPLNPASESRYHRFMTSLLKLAENTIRQLHKMRTINIEADESNIKRRFRKEVYDEIMATNQQLLHDSIKPQAKVIRLDKTKINHSQADLSSVVGMITDFVGEEPEEFEEEVEETSESTSTPSEEPDENQFYKTFIRQLVQETQLDTNTVTNLCRERGQLLNAFINELNQFLFDYIDDQVIVNEGDHITVDEFYVEEMQELVANDFEGIE